MPKYMIRRNLNGRPLVNSLSEFKDDESAIKTAADLQNTLNERFKSEREKGHKPQAVAVVEVLKLLYQGEPFRVDPERSRKRREKAQAAMLEERQEMEAYYRKDPPMPKPKYVSDEDLKFGDLQDALHGIMHLIDDWSNSTTPMTSSLQAFKAIEGVIQETRKGESHA